MLVAAEWVLAGSRRFEPIDVILEGPGLRPVGKGAVEPMVAITWFGEDTAS